MCLPCLWETGSPLHRWENGGPERRGEHVPLPLPKPLPLTPFPLELHGVGGAEGKVFRILGSVWHWDTPAVVSERRVMLWSSAFTPSCPFSLPSPSSLVFQYIIVNSRCVRLQRHQGKQGPDSRGVPKPVKDTDLCTQRSAQIRKSVCQGPSGVKEGLP